MLLCNIPSVTLHLHSLSISYGVVTTSQSLMQPSLCSTTLVYLCLVQLSRNLSRNNLRSIHSCTLSFYASVTPPYYITIALTSHSFCFHTVTPSHDFLSPFLTQLSVPISHTIFAPLRYLALLISRVISIALSHTHTQGVAEPGAWRSTRRCGLVFGRFWQSMIDPTTVWCTLNVHNEGQKGAESPLR